MRHDSYDYLDSLAPPAVVAEFLAAAKTSTEPWQDLLTAPQWRDRGLRPRWFTTQQKGAFYQVVTPAQRQAFLDVGAGSGIVAACLSEDYERGYAIEAHPVFVEFMVHRFRSDSIANVEVIAGSALDIPLPDQCVDLAAVNGVLQWVPRHRPDLAPRTAQLRLLREVRRCLRPGGKLVLAVENAWHHLQIRGVATAGVAPGVTLLPKGIGSVLNRLSKGRPYREHMYSLVGYRRLLAEAGFGQVRPYVLMPESWQPVDVYSFDAPALHELYAKYHRRDRAKTLVRMLSEAMGVPYLWAYLEAAFYLEADR